MRSGRRRKADTRQRILAGATALFAERGLAAATVEDVLVASGVSRRTFYQHFKSRDELLQALYRTFVETLTATLRGALAAAETPVGKVLSGVDAYLAFEQAGGRLLILLQAEALRPESPLSALREAAMDELAALLDEAVVEVAGVRLDPLVYRGLLVMNDGLVLACQRRGRFTDADRERLRGVIAPIFISVLAGLEHLPARPEGAAP